jgi:hypothetical protein
MQINDHLDELKNIRNLMERSSRFISLSGLSGISAGVMALLGAMAYKYYLSTLQIVYYPPTTALPGSRSVFDFLCLDALIVLVGALMLAIWFTTRNARRKGLKIWDSTTKRLLSHLAIPLMIGGLVIVACIRKGNYELIASMTLIFYGLALINASKYTYSDVFYLGLIEVALGLIDLFWPGYSFELWTLGFGVLHIIYGALMYFKYERNTPTPQ